jgi:hypothetical protein
VTTSCIANPQQINRVEFELWALQQVLQPIRNKSTADPQLLTSPTTCGTTNPQQIEQLEFELQYFMSDFLA